MVYLNLTVTNFKLFLLYTDNKIYDNNILHHLDLYKKK